MGFHKRVGGSTVNFQKFPLQLALRCSNISTKSSPISAVAQCYIELLRNYDELIFRQDVRDAPWQSFPVLFLSSSAALGWVRNHPARSASVPIANAIRDRIANPSRLHQFAAVSRLRDEFTIDALGQRAARAWLGAMANDVFEFEICVLYCGRRFRSWSRVN
jgi:hypothetical protein